MNSTWPHHAPEPPSTRTSHAAHSTPHNKQDSHTAPARQTANYTEDEPAQSHSTTTTDADQTVQASTTSHHGQQADKTMLIIRQSSAYAATPHKATNAPHAHNHNTSPPPQRQPPGDDQANQPETPPRGHDPSGDPRSPPADSYRSLVELCPQGGGAFCCDFITS